MLDVDKMILEDRIDNKLSIKEIREKYNCSNNKIYKVLSDNKIQLNTPCKIPKECVNLYKNGASLNAIAKQYNINKHTIKRFLVKSGVQIRTISESKRIHNEDNIKIAKQYYDVLALSIRDISILCGIPERTLRNHIKVTPQTINEVVIVKDYLKLKSISGTAKKHNTSPKKVKEILKSNNIEVVKGGFNQFEVLDVLNLYQNHKESPFNISKKFQCSDETIRNLLKRHDIPLSSRESCIESIIGNILQKHKIKYIRNDRKLLNGLELDFYLPDFNLAIECNGVYWHSEKYKTKSYHFEKYMLCKSKNIQLLQFWESDIIQKSGIIEKMILAKCGRLTDSIMGRKCQFVKVDKQQAKQFHENHHLLGYAKSTTNYGLEYQGELVSVCSFLIGGECNLVRFSSKNRVIGGFSKIIKNVPYQDIITFSDNMYSNGNVYEKTGFKQIKTLTPDYKYLYNGMLYHKFNFRKNRFKNDVLLEYKNGATETELARMNGLLRVWDAGKIKWQLLKT
jgi:uncharacterized protein (DUF433 family)